MSRMEIETEDLHFWFELVDWLNLYKEKADKPVVVRVCARDSVQVRLNAALKRMDKARSILTSNNPTPDCNWGMLDTSDLR